MTTSIGAGFPIEAFFQPIKSNWKPSKWKKEKRLAGKKPR